MQPRQGISKGFLLKVKDPAFVEGLYFLLDVMEVLSAISSQFQTDELFITDVVSKLEKSTVVPL